MRVPSISEAIVLLKEAGAKNPGPWIEHSYSVANAAKSIANHCKDMDEEVAFILGLLHDIGRIEGFSQLHHIVSGYNFLESKGYVDVARVSITHSFPTQDIRSFMGEDDCSVEEVEFIKQFLSRVEYDDYDKLIQLCDAIALPQGACLMEKRLFDVVLRHGKLNCYIIEKWKKYFELKDYFEAKIGTSIYRVLDNIIENTFGFNV